MHRSAGELTHQEAMVAMLHTLDLGEDQSEAIDEILLRYHAKVEQQLAAVHPVLLATIDSARHEIEALLEPDQLEAFQAWIREEHERLRSVRSPILQH
jgi:hypothetical protein